MHLSHNEVTAGLRLLVMLASFTGGALHGHWYWPSRKRLDEEYDAGYRAGRDRGYDVGYATGVDDEARGLAYVCGEDGDEIPREASTATAAIAVLNADTAGRTVYPELAALAALAQPAPDRAESHAEPPEPPAAGVDPNWYAKGLHALADWQAEWHEDAARFDAWLPGYLEHMRASLEPQWSRASRMLESL